MGNKLDRTILLGKIIFWKFLTRPDTSTVQFSYDSNGNMTVLTNPSDVDHEFGYNKVNKQNAYKTPISGTYSSVYDKDRRLKQTNFPSGLQISNIYTDNLLTQTQTPEGNIDYSYLCSSKVGMISKGTESLSYDYDGSLLLSETKNGTLNQVLEFTYNNDFNLSAISYAGSTENLSYDDDGLLIGTGAYAISRNAANGLPEQVSGNALNRTRSFNGYGELTGEEATVNTQAVSGWSVTRNNNGRILSKTETVNGSTIDYAYTYDDMGRLLTVTKDSTLVEEYQYGLNGSRSYEMNALKGEAGRTYSYSVEDHLLSAGGVSYEFDADGFLTKKTQGSDVTNYTYSSRGELLQVSLPNGDTIEYLHDPQGRRIVKKVNGTVVEKYLWLGLTQLMAVYDGNDTLLMRFEYADGRMPLAMTAGGASYYLGYDQVGSLRTVSDASGNVVKEIRYDSFGTILSDSNPALAVPFGFAGGLHDRDTGLVKFGFRDYDPAIGRWVAKDPIFFAGGDVDLYGYVLGDPVNLVDPQGLVGIEEKVRQVLAVGPVDALEAKRLGDEAAKAAEESGLKGLHNGPADAYRHCLWSCLMTKNKKVGYSQAKEVGDIHEKCGKNPANETSMDLNNNADGRLFGVIGLPCESSCKNAAQSDALQTSP